MFTDPKTGITYPFFQSQVGEFGQPNYEGFARRWIVRIDLGEFKDAFSHVKDWNHGTWFGFSGNKVLEAPCMAALRAVAAKGLAQELCTFDGCFNIRPPKAGGMRYSMHAYGLALDLNAAQNAFGAKPRFSEAFVACFAANGFEWGGLWSPPGVDGMHFQIVWVKVRCGLLAPTAWGGNGAQEIPASPLKVQSPQAGTPAPPVVYRLTSPTMRGEAVFKIQCRLNHLGYLRSDQTDWIYGPKTAAAVQDFQKGHGLVADGAAGPLTLAALGVTL